jgi:hypothetical protein
MLDVTPFMARFMARDVFGMPSDVGTVTRVMLSGQRGLGARIRLDNNRR